LARGWKGVSTLIPGLVMTSLLIIVTALLIARMLDSISLAVEQRRTPLYTMKISKRRPRGPIRSRGPGGHSIL